MGSQDVRTAWQGLAGSSTFLRRARHLSLGIAGFLQEDYTTLHYRAKRERGTEVSPTERGLCLVEEHHLLALFSACMTIFLAPHEAIHVFFAKEISEGAKFLSKCSFGTV